MVDLNRPGAFGIDTADWQGLPDWWQVAGSGKSFAYIKASEGDSASYPTVDSQFQGAVNAKVIPGLYHFAHPALSPEANADSLALQVNRLGAIAGCLPPCLDLEIGQGDFSVWAARFIARLRAATGCRRVMVYAPAWFFANQIGERWMDPDVILWIANFGAPLGKPSYMSPRVAIHQYSKTGRVPGIVGNVDLDYAIWPLARILGEDVLTDEQDRKLSEIHSVLTGMMSPWGGGITDISVDKPEDIETAEKYNLAEFMLRNNVESHQSLRLIQQILARLDTITTDSSAALNLLSRADINAIAEAVAGFIGAKLTRQP